MKKAIIFTSVSENTKKLADVIKQEIGDVAYFGKPSAEALDADVLILGSWTAGFSFSPDLKEFLPTISGKKVFLFMTAGYGNSKEFFDPIINSFKAALSANNEIIGEFICQGKVTEAKQEAIKKMDMDKYLGMKEQLDNSQSHPDSNDIANLKKALEVLR